MIIIGKPTLKWLDPPEVETIVYHLNIRIRSIYIGEDMMAIGVLIYPNEGGYPVDTIST